MWLAHEADIHMLMHAHFSTRKIAEIGRAQRSLAEESSCTIMVPGRGTCVCKHRAVVWVGVPDTYVYWSILVRTAVRPLEETRSSGIRLQGLARTDLRMRSPSLWWSCLPNTPSVAGNSRRVFVFVARDRSRGRCYHWPVTASSSDPFPRSMMG